MDAVRRLASLAVCVCLFTAMPAVGAYADDADFVVKNGVLTEYNGNDSSVKIPESVFEIADGVFADNGSITAVDLSDRVVYVGDNAFYGCENLKTVSGTKNVKKLGARAFEKTAWFDSLTDDVKMLNNVVIGCKANVKKIVIPENALSVAPMAFYGNTAVEQLKLPDGLQEIGSFAFYDCKSLGTLEYGNNSTGMNLSYIGTEAFKNTKWYDLNDGDFLSINGILIKCNAASKSVVIPDDITQIAGGTFYENGMISDVHVPHGLYYIGDFAFAYSGVKNINLGDCPLVYIGNGAFSHCYSLGEAALGKTVSYIGEGAFEGCTELKLKVEFASYAYDYAEANGLLHAPAGVPGDVDGSGSLTMVDVVTLQKYIAKLIPLNIGSLQLADIDGSGSVTMEDVTFMQRRIAGLV